MYRESMVDIETLSTENNALVLSIGAVHFNIEDEDNYDTLDNSVRENLNIQLPLSFQYEVLKRHMSLSTVGWWLGQNKAAQLPLSEHITEASKVLPHNDEAKLRGALNKFAAFVKDTNMWGNGATFDNVIIRSLFSEMGMLHQLPPFYTDKDLRTLQYLGGGVKPNIDRGVAHDALDDAKYQVLCAQHYWRQSNGKSGTAG